MRCRYSVALATVVVRKNAALHQTRVCFRASVAT